MYFLNSFAQFAGSLIFFSILIYLIVAVSVALPAVLFLYGSERKKISRIQYFFHVVLHLWIWVIISIPNIIIVLYIRRKIKRGHTIWDISKQLNWTTLTACEVQRWSQMSLYQCAYMPIDKILDQ
ncbi:MAG: hypothetical protein WCT49_02900 [Candidatus Paceibacterota bacterium]|jgi:hypothetical protein|nr:hypothetical protein [Candidatus Paceibacterota bacterium]